MIIPAFALASANFNVRIPGIPSYQTSESGSPIQNLSLSPCTYLPWAEAPWQI